MMSRFIIFLLVKLGFAEFDPEWMMPALRTALLKDNILSLKSKVEEKDHWADSVDYIENYIGNSGLLLAERDQFGGHHSRNLFVLLKRFIIQF